MNVKIKNKYLIIMLVLLTLISTIIPNFSNAEYNLGDDITLQGYGTVPYHLKNAKYDGNYVSTHLVGYYDNGTFYPAFCLNVDKPRG